MEEHLVVCSEEMQRHLENLAAVAGTKLVLQLGKSTGDTGVGEAKGLPNKET